MNQLSRGSIRTAVSPQENRSGDPRYRKSWIRNRWRKGDEPWIIALTANALAGEWERYLAAGMNDYVSKPVRIQDFKGVLGRCPSAGLPEDPSLAP